jgi:hypothetical protein
MTPFPAVEFGAINGGPLTELLQRAFVVFTEPPETSWTIYNWCGLEGPLKCLSRLRVELGIFVKTDLDATIAQARPLRQAEKRPP